MRHRFGWALLGAAMLLAVLAIARGIEAGPVDPPGPVGSTMRRLDDLLPAWDSELTAAGPDACNSKRFQCIFPTDSNGTSVFDRETGLVWERAPAVQTIAWSNAVDHCAQMLLGNHYGWRMPSVDELASLLLADAPGPFNLGSAPVFWTTSAYGGQDSNPLRRTVSFSGVGSVGYGDSGDPQPAIRVWCVRGGTAHDPQ